MKEKLAMQSDTDRSSRSSATRTSRHSLHPFYTSGHATEAKSNTNISYEVESNLIRAYLEDKEYARLEFMNIEDDCWLSRIAVSASNSIMDIGPEILKVAKSHLEGFLIAAVAPHPYYRFSLTEEEQELIKTCLERGILSPDQLRFASAVPLTSDANEDPGLNATLLDAYALSQSSVEEKDDEDDPRLSFA